MEKVNQELITLISKHDNIDYFKASDKLLPNSDPLVIKLSHNDKDEPSKLLSSIVSKYEDLLHKEQKEGKSPEKIKQYIEIIDKGIEAIVFFDDRLEKEKEIRIINASRPPKNWDSLSPAIKELVTEFSKMDNQDYLKMTASKIQKEVMHFELVDVMTAKDPRYDAAMLIEKVKSRIEDGYDSDQKTLNHLNEIIKKSKAVVTEFDIALSAKKETSVSNIAKIRTGAESKKDNKLSI